MTYPRTLVVTSCTGEKKFRSDNSLTKDDFKNLSRLQSRTEKLANYSSMSLTYCQLDS